MTDLPRAMIRYAVDRLYTSNPTGHRWEYVPGAEFSNYFPIDGPRVEHFTTRFDQHDDVYYLVCPCDAEIEAGLTLGDDNERAAEHVNTKHAGVFEARKARVKR
jgi:hypothetical protein